MDGGLINSSLETCQIPGCLFCARSVIHSVDVACAPWAPSGRSTEDDGVVSETHALCLHQFCGLMGTWGDIIHRESWLCNYGWRGMWWCYESRCLGIGVSPGTCVCVCPRVDGNGRGAGGQAWAPVRVCSLFSEQWEAIMCFEVEERHD